MTFRLRRGQARPLEITNGSLPLFLLPVTLLGKA